MDYQLKNLKATTIICVRRKNKQGKSQVAMAGDGQVTLGNTVMKNNANKIRRLYQGKIISGFAGAVADALTLYERIEENLEQYRGDLMKASVEMTRAWRTDKYLRRLEAMLLIADEEKTFLLSGTGEVIEPESDVIAIGSGGEFARSAALALLDNTKLSAQEIARKSLEIAGKVCIYTNQHITLEEL